MAKKKTAVAFNMTQAIQGELTANPKLGLKEVSAAVLEKHPVATINEKSFTVAFYTARKKLGIVSGSGRKKSVKKVVKKYATKKTASPTRSTIDFAGLQAAANFVNQLGGTEAALEAIKQLQAVQVK